MEARLPTQDSATGRGIKTSIQGFIAASVLLLGALYTAIKAVPGCSEAIIQVVSDNWALIAGTFGLSTGAVSFIWNVLRKNVKNY